ncbi:hypothetical protein NDU88_004607 [Pleurodeles waltl]|uniref:Uncharacterized protein n=1 Tax=Pleurodeles waltl TaxID=8319 RepID=A0AAV7V3X2_PLEWA|nr:hypothetical protein NDU88_004607 [Pleurodeles waltl]
MTKQLLELNRSISALGRRGAGGDWRSARKQWASLGQDRAEYALLPMRYSFYVEGTRMGPLLGNRVHSLRLSTGVESFRSSEGHMIRGGPSALQQEKEFGKYSGVRVNVQKSQTLNIAVPLADQQYLERLQLAPTISDTTLINYCLLAQQVRRGLA